MRQTKRQRILTTLGYRRGWLVWCDRCNDLVDTQIANSVHAAHAVADEHEANEHRRQGGTDIIDMHEYWRAS